MRVSKDQWIDASDGMRPGDTQVLIAGAGPVGLSLAVDLARHGIAVRIIDTLAQPTSESRAIVVHSRTLDHFEALGVLDAIMARAIVSTGMEVHSVGRTIAAVGFGEIHAVHPYSVSLVQSETEAVLTARLAQLGVLVERSSRLTSYAAGPDYIDAIIAGPAGQVRTVRAQYLVGADGARSTVRRLMGQQLSGSFAGEDVLLGDVDADHDYERSHFHAFFSPGETTALLFPLRGNRVRLFAQLPPGTDPARPVTQDWLQSAAEERGVKVRITQAHWLTRFELKHGQVPQYRAGRVFLAGDAAHIHSPAGALGMNTGIQDAINLGWKLATALRNQNCERLLQSYHLERHPIGAQVVALTTQITKIATIKNPLAQRLRNTLMHCGIHMAPLTDRMADTIEQQRVHYRDSPIVDGTGHTLRPGDFLYLPGTHVAAALAADDDHVAIVLPGDAPAAALTGIPVLTVPPSDIDALKDASGLRHGGIVIVRPDGYIGHISSDTQHGSDLYRKSLTTDASPPAYRTEQDGRRGATSARLTETARGLGNRLGAGDVPVVIHVCDRDSVGLQIEHCETEPGPLLAVLSYCACAAPGDGRVAAGRGVGIRQDGHSAVAQAPRVADAGRSPVSDGPVLVTPPPGRDAVRVQDLCELVRKDTAEITLVVDGHELMMTEQHELAR
jgi:2-polyprenyl-6-methoxyphenol hydroxylase-like FAD-dependent oxidoreductase